MKLEDLQPDATVRGILPDALVTAVSVAWHGSDALTLVYRGPNGRVADEILYRHDEPRLEIVEAGRPWSFDGDGALFRLVSEAHRIRLAHLFDPVLAVHTSLVEPLRFLLADAWLWARTVKSPNPAFAQVDVPLASTFMLSTKAGKEAYVEPVIEPGSAGIPAGKDAGAPRGYRFTVKVGTPMPFEYLRPEAKAGRMGMRLMAIVAEGDRGRVYLAPTPAMEAIALSEQPTDVPETDLPAKALGFRVQEYGMTKWRDLFTPRQKRGAGSSRGSRSWSRRRRSTSTRTRCGRPSSRGRRPMAFLPELPLARL